MALMLEDDDKPTHCFIHVHKEFDGRCFWLATDCLKPKTMLTTSALKADAFPIEEAATITIQLVNSKLGRGVVEIMCIPCDNSILLTPAMRKILNV